MLLPFYSVLLEKTFAIFQNCSPFAGGFPAGLKHGCKKFVVR